MENTGDPLLYSQLAKLENWLWYSYLFIFIFLQATITNAVTLIFALIVSHNNN